MENKPQKKRVMKLYPKGVKTDTEIKMENIKNELLTKWKKDIPLNTIHNIISKKGNSHERKIILLDDNPIVQEQCIKCQEWKPLYDFYLRKNYMELLSSKESINNDSKNPCHKCSILTRKEKADNPKIYIQRLLSNYPLLKNDWYKNQIDKNKGLFCSILNVPLKESSDVDWQVSIQNNRCDIKEHLPEHCEIICREANVPQHNAIPDLKIAYTELFTYIINKTINPFTEEQNKEFCKKWADKFKLSPKESGVESKSRENGKISSDYDKELRFKHLKTMFTNDSKAVHQHDKKSKRTPPTEKSRLNATNMFSIGEKQGWNCYYSGIRLSMNRNDWNYPSLERLDNSLNHTIENTVLICRLLNTTGQWSSEKLNFAMKYQKLVKLTK